MSPFPAPHSGSAAWQPSCRKANWSSVMTRGHFIWRKQWAHRQWVFSGRRMCLIGDRFAGTVIVSPSVGSLNVLNAASNLFPHGLFNRLCPAAITHTRLSKAYPPEKYLNWPRNCYHPQKTRVPPCSIEHFLQNDRWPVASPFQIALCRSADLHNAWRFDSVLWHVRGYRSDSASAR